ncbi:MAG: alpha/beta fold hydrolase [Planctomycetota bacterium]|jgi:pimeloyl-ACP methyl ester carboxylesterase
MLADGQVVDQAWYLRHWAAIGIALTCLSLLIFVVLWFAKYIRIVLNLFCDTPPPLSMGPLDFERLEGEEVRFRSFDGISLRGMYIRTADRAAVKGTVVFCHEYGSDMHSCARYGRPLVDAGFDIFTFDYRGHGESSCTRHYHQIQWPSDKELEDTLGACAFVQAELGAQGRNQDIGVFGISRGAGAGLLAACSDDNVKAIVCDGAFSTDATVIALMRRWAHIFSNAKLIYQRHSDLFWRILFWLTMRFAQRKLNRRFPSVRLALRDMRPRPILFIHGQRDSYIRVEQTRILYTDAPDPKYLWIVEKAKHNQSVIIQPEQYAARTIAFFRRHLADENVDESQIGDPKSIEVA